MKIVDRIISFSHASPVDTGCGKVYNLASTDLIYYSLPITASFELADQSGPGELHQHHISHELYICIGGEGSVFWGTQNKCAFKEGDILAIAPGTIHALNAAPGKSISVLVVSYPRFTQSDLYPMIDTVKKRKEEIPSFFLKNIPSYGTLMTYPHITINRIHIQQPYIAATVQLLFVLTGSGILKASGQQAPIIKYDSMAMERGDAILVKNDTPLDAITVQIT